MSEIKVNDYIRTRKSGIKQVIEIGYKEKTEEIYYYEKRFDIYKFGVLKEDIINHNEDLLELIKKGDILEVCATNKDNILKTEVKDEFKGGFIYNAIKTGNLKIATILTKEQYEENSFKVGE